GAGRETVLGDSEQRGGGHRGGGRTDRPAQVPGSGRGVQGHGERDDRGDARISHRVVNDDQADRGEQHGERRAAARGQQRRDEKGDRVRLHTGRPAVPHGGYVNPQGDGHRHGNRQRGFGQGLAQQGPRRYTHPHALHS